MYLSREATRCPRSDTGRGGLSPAGMPPEAPQEGVPQWNPSGDSAARKPMRDDRDSCCAFASSSQESQASELRGGGGSVGKAASAVVLGRGPSSHSAPSIPANRKAQPRRHWPHPWVLPDRSSREVL